MAYPENHLGSGASGETRTLTLLPEPDFESGASTSSATEAVNSAVYIQLAMLTNQFICNFYNSSPEQPICKLLSVDLMLLKCSV